MVILRFKKQNSKFTGHVEEGNIGQGYVVIWFELKYCC